MSECPEHREHQSALQHPQRPEAGFPRITFVGNSSSCIKTDSFEGYGYYCSLLRPTVRDVLRSDLARSVLLSLGVAPTCNAD
jgi:hypothetical protein